MAVRSSLVGGIPQTFVGNSMWEGIVLQDPVEAGNLTGLQSQVPNEVDLSQVVRLVLYRH